MTSKEKQALKRAKEDAEVWKTIALQRDSTISRQQKELQQLEDLLADSIRLTANVTNQLTGFNK